jgi:hypothetical protein
LTEKSFNKYALKWKITGSLIIIISSLIVLLVLYTDITPKVMYISILLTSIYVAMALFSPIKLINTLIVSTTILLGYGCFLASKYVNYKIALVNLLIVIPIGFIIGLLINKLFLHLESNNTN